MSDNLRSYINEYHYDAHYLNLGLLDISTIISQIQLSSLPYKRLFVKHRYALPLLEESEQPKIIAQLLYTINKASSDQFVFTFLSDLCIKLINEHILILEQANTLIHFYFFSSHCCNSKDKEIQMNKLYFNQFLRIIVQTRHQSFFDILQSFEKSLLVEAKLYLLQFDFLIDMLLFNNSIEFLSSIIKWNYSQSIVAQLIDQLASVFFKHKDNSIYEIILLQIQLLKTIKLTEQIELSENPQKLMNGIEIANGFHLGNPITFPNEDFNIEFSFIKYAEKDDGKKTIVTFGNFSGILLSFYILKNEFYFSYYQLVTKVIKVEYGKTIHIQFKQTLPSFFPPRQNKALIYINHSKEPITITPSDYLKGNIDFKIINFNGQIGKILIYKQKQSAINEKIELLIDPLVLYYQYQQKKKYQLINNLEPNLLIQNYNNDERNDGLDKPFEYISFKEAFNENEGISYLLLIMFYLQSKNKKNFKEKNELDTRIVYNCIQSILEFVFDMYKDSNENWKEPLFTVLYSVNLLIDKVIFIFLSKLLDSC